MYNNRKVIKLNTYKLSNNGYRLRSPKVIARVKLCGGAVTFTIFDDMPFEVPTDEQRENLKKTFGIEIELL